MSVASTPSDAVIASALVAHGLVGDVEDAHVRGYELPRIRAIHRALRKHAAAPRPSVLDVGYLHGFVPFTLRALDSELEITATERDEAAVREARLRAAELLPGLRVETLDLTRFPDFERTYHAVILGEVLEHISVEHLPHILGSLRGILAPAGIIVITTPNLHGLIPRLRHALGADFLHDPVAHAAMGMPHINLLSARMLADVARSEGLDLAAVEFYDFTSRMRARSSRRARATAALRSATLSCWAPATRDDLLMVLRRSESETTPSPVFARPNVSLREAVRAARELSPRTYRRACRAA